MQKNSKMWPLITLNAIMGLFGRIGIVPVPDKVGWTEQNRIKYAKKHASHLQQNVDIGTIVLDENQWNGLEAYDKALVFYTKLVNTLVIHRKNKLKKLASDF